MKQVFCFLSSHKFFGIAELWLKILVKRKGKRTIQVGTLLMANYLTPHKESFYVIPQKKYA